MRRVFVINRTVSLLFHNYIRVSVGQVRGQHVSTVAIAMANGAWHMKTADIYQCGNLTTTLDGRFLLMNASRTRGHVNPHLLAVFSAQTGAWLHVLGDSVAASFRSSKSVCSLIFNLKQNVC